MNGHYWIQQRRKFWKQIQGSLAKSRLHSHNGLTWMKTSVVTWWFVSEAFKNDLWIKTCQEIEIKKCNKFDLQSYCDIDVITSNASLSSNQAPYPTNPKTLSRQQSIYRMTSHFTIRIVYLTARTTSHISRCAVRAWRHFLPHRPPISTNPKTLSRQKTMTF